MLKLLYAGVAGLIALAPSAFNAVGDPEIGKPAPTFSLVDTYGKNVSLNDFKGKWVVLEWLNHGCPYVKRAYTGSMQKLQEEYTGKGVVWLSIVSSASGTQGYNEPDAANKLTTEKNAKPTAVLLDPEGTTGRAYGAKTTPHMFVINPDGVLIYDGALDDKARPAEGETAKNYVAAALTEAMAGKAVTVSKTQPYGCSVKYAKPQQ